MLDAFRIVYGMRMVIGILCLYFAASTNAADEYAPLPTGKVIYSYDAVEYGADPLVPPVLISDQDEPIAETVESTCHCQKTSSCHGCCDDSCCRNGPLFRRWRQLRDSYWGCPEFCIPEQLGSSVHMHFNKHVGNGQAAQLVLYHYDFFDGPNNVAAKLNPYGVNRLRKMTRMLVHSPLPLIIERSANDPKLDESRRTSALKELERISPVPIAMERIIIGEPPALGLRGDQALRIYENLLRQTLQQGTYTSGASGGGGSSFTPKSGFTP